MARVLLTGFCAVPGPRRAGVQLRHVIRTLMQEHTLDLLVVRDGDQSYVERSGNVRILRVPVAEGAPGGPIDATTQIQSFQRALKRQLEGADYDVVHCCDSWTGFIVLEARRRLDFALIYDLTRAPIGESASNPDLDARYARYEHACLRSADVVLAPTPVAVAALADRASGKVLLSPPGVDVDRFDWDELPAAGVPRIVYTGAIDASRGVRILIRAMAAVAREAEAQLVLAGPVGSPHFAAMVNDQIRELGLTDRVDLIGPVDHDQIPALLATATVCVAPSAADLLPNRTALFPTKLLEYLACRRAVVAPKRETVALVVKDEQEALLFDPGDPMDLARKILRLIGDPSLRDRIAEAGYERVRREFTASGARRALRGAYAVFGERFRRVEAPDKAAQKADLIGLIGDDDFEATVIESAAELAAGDTGLHPMTSLEVLDEVLETLDASQSALPVGPASARLESVASRGAVESPVRIAEESGETNVVVATWARGGTEVDTPEDGLRTSAWSARDNVVIAGEIDVPTPTPQLQAPEFDDAIDSDTGITPARTRNS